MKSPSVLFTSWHFYLDASNGASISARELLRALSHRGWDVKTFCGSAVDNPRVSDVADVLNSQGIAATRVVDDSGAAPYSIDSFSDDGIRSLVYRPADDSIIPKPLTGEIFLEYLRKTLAKLKPDVVMTYGGFWLAPKVISAIRNSSAKSVFLLLNFAYKEKELFDDVDLTLTLSQFAADAYRDRIGIKALAIPPLMRREDVVPEEAERADSSRKYVLFINPSVNKGVYLFARIASEMAKSRPDIPFLVVEGCSTSRDLLATGVDLRSAGNIFLMPRTPRPNDFYRHAKITLVPSVFEETFGRVAAESMLSGVPVIGSDRGSLPEVIDNAGTLIHIPEKYTPATTVVPTADEVAPWIAEIIRLWDDPEYYAVRQNQALERAKLWDYGKVAEQYVSALTSLLDA